jgi:phage baseplate assembly protein W
MSRSRIGVVFPLEEAQDGIYEILEHTDLTKVINQNIKMVLLTRKGERLSRPSFGVGLHNYLFENRNGIENNSTYQPSLRDNIITQVRTYIPEIRIQDISISYGTDGRSLTVKMKYIINDSQTASTFDLTIGEIEQNISF